MKRKRKAFVRKHLQKHGLPAMYNYFLDKKPNTTIGYAQYVDMIRDANELFVKEMIEKGKPLNMGSNLGRIQIQKVPRIFTPDKYSNPHSIDWKSTKELDCNKEKIVKLVYFTDSHYFRIVWSKIYGKLPNRKFYRFKPTTGAKGFKTKLKEKLYADPFAETIYPNKHLRKHGRKGSADSVSQSADPQNIS